MFTKVIHICQLTMHVYTKNVPYEKQQFTKKYIYNRSLLLPTHNSIPPSPHPHHTHTHLAHMLTHTHHPALARLPTIPDLCTKRAHNQMANHSGTSWWGGCPKDPLICSLSVQGKLRWGGWGEGGELIWFILLLSLKESP